MGPTVWPTALPSASYWDRIDTGRLLKGLVPEQELRDRIGKTYSVPKTLSTLACDEHASVRYWASVNTLTPVRDLVELSYDSDSEVAYRALTSLVEVRAFEFLKENACEVPLPLSKLRVLREVPLAAVRRHLVGNMSVPDEVREEFLKDPYPTVRRAAVQHPGVRIEALCEAAREEREPEVLQAYQFHNDAKVRRALAENRFLTYAQLRALVKDKAPSVRAQIAKHPCISEAMRSALAKDEHPDVRASVARDLGDAETDSGTLKVVKDSVVMALLRAVHPLAALATETGRAEAVDSLVRKKLTEA